MKSNIIKFNAIKTDNGVFISDCFSSRGYDYKYHRTELVYFLFDNQLPSSTWNKNWLKIKNIPTKVQKKETEFFNVRYEIKNKKLITNDMPEIITKDESRYYDCDILDCYYSFESDSREILADVEFEYEILMEIENFEEPVKINYNSIKKSGWGEKDYIITNTSIQHQMLDKIVFPEIMLHTRPCSISSSDLYALTRQYVIDNIDNKVAKITSNYNFCFTVKKLIPLVALETVQYRNIFARTKKERNKIKYVTKEFKEVEIFNMTSDVEKYKGYKILEGIVADNEADLKNKIDEWLEVLIYKINKPLQQCECCSGTGYKQDEE